jgi:hypothetical protein
VTCVFCDACPFRGYKIRVQEGSEQLRVTTEHVVAAEARKQEYNGKLEEYIKQAVSSTNTEEYKKSDCEDLTCALKALCVI